MSDDFTQNLIVFGIPLLGVLGCFLGGRYLLQLVRHRRMRSFVAVLLCLAVEGAPWVLAEGAFHLGDYLEPQHKIYALSGERALGLFFSMGYYSFFAFFFFFGFLWRLNKQDGSFHRSHRH